MNVKAGIHGALLLVREKEGDVWKQVNLMPFEEIEVFEYNLLSGSVEELTGGEEQTGKIEEKWRNEDGVY
ncbi:hypothetical protein [Hydrogenobacter thermophilus]|jgi:hypothetical protein|uniref:hypothetical protein n=1 Tax=Hydrogenobacter thermophilus TaxID=940 RepID=UPI0030FC2ACD